MEETDEIQCKIMKLKYEMKDTGLKMNINKTKIMFGFDWVGGVEQKGKLSCSVQELAIIRFCAGNEFIHNAVE